MQRPSRPFGVTLAIIACLLLFTVFPLMEVGMLLSVRLHFANLTFEGNGPQPFAIGADFLGIPDSKILIKLDGNGPFHFTYTKNGEYFRWISNGM